MNPVPLEFKGLFILSRIYAVIGIGILGKLVMFVLRISKRIVKSIFRKLKKRLFFYFDRNGEKNTYILVFALSQARVIGQWIKEGDKIDSMTVAYFNSKWVQSPF